MQHVLRWNCFWMSQGNCAVEVNTMVGGEKRLPWTSPWPKLGLILGVRTCNTHQWRKQRKQRSQDNRPYYYTTSSASGQDELNLALWLATRAGKMELSCPLRIRVMSRKEHLSCYGVLSCIINPLLTKLVRSKWLDIGLVLFLRVYRPRLRLGP